MAERENWLSRKAFILAAIGSAIGLGNIWRFPFKCYENGGGAFLIAYVIALITAGIPLLIMELSLGHKFKLAAPLAFRKVGKKFEWVGWWAVLVAFTVVTYYAVVMAWGLNYSVFSFTEAWGNDPGDFFFNKYLGLTTGPYQLGGLRLPIMIALVAGWILIVRSIWRGAKTVSKVVYLTVILPWLLLIIFVIRGVTLPGSGEGILYYITPHFEKLLDASVWISAYGQVFYSLSIGFGIMIAYSSFLPKHADIVNSALIIALSDAATAFVGGFAVFGSLGYYAGLTGQAVQNVLKGGPGLAFVTYPTIISHLPLPRLFGILFFLMLLTLAIDSAFSLVEAVSSSLRDKLGWSNKKANITTSLIGLCLGLIFVTGAGLFWLDIVDKWLEFFGISAIVLVECIVLGWFYKINKLREYANSFSEVKIGPLWNYLIKFVIPVIIAALIGRETVKLIRFGYEGYPSSALLIAGWGLALLLPLIAIILNIISRKREVPEVDEIIPAEHFRREAGYRRLNNYLIALVFLGLVMALTIILGSYYPVLKSAQPAIIVVCISLALIGGAVYFSLITLHDTEHRQKWIEKAFKK